MKPKKTRGDGKDGADKEGARNTWLDKRSVVDRSTDHLLVSLNSDLDLAAALVSCRAFRWRVTVDIFFF